MEHLGTFDSKQKKLLIEEKQPSKQRHHYRHNLMNDGDKTGIDTDIEIHAIKKRFACLLNFLAPTPPL